MTISYHGEYASYCACEGCTANLKRLEDAWFSKSLHHVCMACARYGHGCKLPSGHGEHHWFGSRPIEDRDPGDEN